MSTSTSTRYDLGNCELAYLGETDLYLASVLRFRQLDGDDEVQVTLPVFDAVDLLNRLAELLASDPTPLIAAQLHGQDFHTKGDIND